MFLIPMNLLLIGWYESICLLAVAIITVTFKIGPVLKNIFLITILSSPGHLPAIGRKNGISTDGTKISDRVGGERN